MVSSPVSPRHFIRQIKSFLLLLRVFFFLWVLTQWNLLAKKLNLPKKMDTVLELLNRKQIVDE